MAEQDLVPGSGWISSDSSFYGDEDEQDRLLSLDRGLEPNPFWANKSKDLNVIAAIRWSAPLPKLINYREGHNDSWQLRETVDDFLQRLPPLTTSCMTCEWIWVENPHPAGRAKHGSSRLDDFLQRGFQLLEQSSQARVNIQNRAEKRVMAKLLNQESKVLEQRITDLATETNVLTGKWMLFPSLEDVTRVWRLVVDGVINNRLGPTAKVASNEDKEGGRLICIYTKDFRDDADVLRVLQELVTMGLAGSERSIYYKSDPYTYLNIYRETAAEYGLRASLYSSQTMLAQAGRLNPKSGSQNNQTNINGFFKKENRV